MYLQGNSSVLMWQSQKRTHHLENDCVVYHGQDRVEQLFLSTSPGPLLRLLAADPMEYTLLQQCAACCVTIVNSIASKHILF